MSSVRDNSLGTGPNTSIIYEQIPEITLVSQLSNKITTQGVTTVSTETPTSSLQSEQALKDSKQPVFQIEPKTSSYQVSDQRSLTTSTVSSQRQAVAAPNQPQNSSELISTGNTKLPAPAVCRNYKCAKCSFGSNRAKLFLFHQKEAHGENIAVYGCNRCEYASRHKNKVLRHKRLVHKISSQEEDVNSCDESSRNAGGMQSGGTNAAVDRSSCVLNGPMSIGKTPEGVSSCSITAAGGSLGSGVSIAFGSANTSKSISSCPSAVTSGGAVGPDNSGSGLILGASSTSKIVANQQVIMTAQQINLRPNVLPVTSSMISGKVEGAKLNVMVPSSAITGALVSIIKPSIVNQVAQKTKQVLSGSTIEGKPEQSYCAASITGNGNMSDIGQKKETKEESEIKIQEIVPINTSNVFTNVLVTDTPSNASDRCSASPLSDAESQDGSNFVNHYASQADFSNGFFRCRLCRYSNPHKWKIASHIRSSHSKRTIFKCPFCPFCTERKIEWCAHKTTHSGKLVFSCTECAYQTTMKRNYERHQERHLMNGPRRCSLCTYSSTGEGAIQRHMAEYHPPSPGGVATSSQSSASLKFASFPSLNSNKISQKIPIKVVTEGDNGVANAINSFQQINVSRQCISIVTPSSMTLAEHLQAPKQAVVMAGSSISSLDHTTVVGHLGLPVHGSSTYQPSQISSFQLEQSNLSSDSSTSQLSSQNFSQQPTILENASGLINQGSASTVCRVCGLNLQTDAKLRVHLIAHSANARWACSICPLRYKRPADLNRHMKRKHGSALKDGMTRRIAPAQISHNLPVQISLNLPAAHSSSAPKNIPVNYSTIPAQEDVPLNLSLKQEAEEDLSMIIPTQEEPLDLSIKSKPAMPEDQAWLKCTQCAYVSKRSSDMRRHALVHCSEKRFCCTHCGKCYKLQFDLTRHLSKAHSGQNSAGVGSDYDGNDSDNSLAGIVIPGIPSALQELNFSSDFTSGSLEQKSVEERGNVAGLTCTYCSYVGKYPGEVERHERLHTGEKPHRCHFCAYKTIWKGDMKRHLMKHHSKEIDNHGDLAKLVELTYCPTGSSVTAVKGGKMNVNEFSNQSNNPNLDYNMNVDHERKREHSKISPSCVTLGRQPKHSNISEVAYRKLYQCPLCSFVSAAPSKLTAHMEVHDNCLRFMCTVCGKRSNWVWDVRKHIRKCHPDEDVMIKELSEHDAKTTLEDYKTRLTTCEFNPAYDKNDDEDDEDDDNDSVEKFNINIRNAVENQALKFERDEKEDMDVESLAEEYANEIAAMFYGNAGSSNESSSTSHQNSSSVLLSMPSEKKVIIGTSSSGTKRFRPYKCSQCGRRSNWRWDLNKHIRATHPSAHLIELSSQEARATFNEVIQREIKERLPQPSASPVKSVSEGTPMLSWRNKPFQCCTCGYRSNWKCDLTKHIKALHPSATVITLDNDTASRTLAEYDESHSKINKTPENTSPSKMATVYQQADMVSYTVDSMKLKRFQCSGCPYRSNFRSDVGRHIRHKHDRLACRIIVLTEADASSTLKSYLDTWARKKFVPSPSKKRSSHGSTMGDISVSQSMDIGLIDQDARSDKGLYWKCKMCSFADKCQNSVWEHWQKEHLERNMSVDISEDGDGSKSIVSLLDVTEEVVHGTEYEIQLDEHKDQAPIKYEPDIKPEIKNKASDIYAQNYLSCDICPFSTNKIGLLNIHQTYHKPQSKNKYKCKYCPYYVGASRLLHQHTKLHTMKATSANAVLPDSVSGGEVQLPQGPVRYLCPVCPYIGCNHNDFLYHRQFHRSHSSLVSFKCDACPYWVSQKRLLAQHVKVHSVGYLERRSRYDAMASSLSRDHVRRESLENTVELSAKNLSESYCKSFNSSKSDRNHGRNKKADSSSDVKYLKGVFDEDITDEINGDDKADDLCTDVSHLYDANRKLYRCNRCPYSNYRRDHLVCHMRFHIVRSELQCFYCDYSVSRMHLLNQHVRVHGASAIPPLRGGYLPEDSVTEIVHMTRKRQQKLDSEGTSPSGREDLREYEGLVNSFRETGRIGENCSDAVNDRSKVVSEETLKCAYMWGLELISKTLINT